MNFENPLFLMGSMTGAIFVIGGLLLYFLPPKKINSLYGYRTESSMRNLDRWNFAQKYSAKVMISGGIVFSFISIAGLFIVGNERLSLIVAMVLLFLICAIIYFSTEKKLKENFTDQP